MPRPYFLSLPYPEVAKHLDLLSERGFGVEITLYDTEWLLHTSGRQRVRKLGGTLAERGIGVSVHGPIFDLNPGSLDTVVRKHTRRAFEKAIEVALDLGAAGITFHTGFSPLLPDRTLPGWLSLSLELWNRLATLADGAGLTLTVENMFEPTPDLLLELADSVESDSLRFCLDVSHTAIYSTLGLPRWFEAVSPRLRSVHLNDTDGFSDEHLALGRGMLDFKDVFGRLAALPQKPIMVLEMDLERALESLDTIARVGLRETQLELL
ncbi:MAG: sugar phosphate isomerase/epimerase [Gemmatimonadetes bacterium]|nr:sugar phosphate isomerase/epimerase [Gemmatimonadota bacterium]